MDGILLINKEQGLTSREVVNQVSKKLKMKKVGHAGTLDPLARGLLVIGVGKATKIMDLLTMDSKEYIATVKVGITTDTLDITGKIINEQKDFLLDKKKLQEVLKNFPKEYYQEVPLYSAVKINGKRLYEYARSGMEVERPKRLVKIFSLKLLEVKKDEFTFSALVSKGTYIRSLIKDIGDNLNIFCTMKDLIRTKSGKFKIEDSYMLEDDFKLIKIADALDLEKVVIKDSDLLKKVQNGQKIKLDMENNKILLVDSDNEALAIYIKDENKEFKAFKVF